MQRQKVHALFGQCYKSGDYGKLDELFRNDITYESFDCLYKFHGTNDVLEVLSNDTREKLRPYYGYYRHKGIFIGHLRECVLLCDNITVECKKIMYFSIRFGKIQCIRGLNPKENKFTRGIII